MLQAQTVRKTVKKHATAKEKLIIKFVLIREKLKNIWYKICS